MEEEKYITNQGNYWKRRGGKATTHRKYGTAEENLAPHGNQTAVYHWPNYQVNEILISIFIKYAWANMSICKAELTDKPNK